MGITPDILIYPDKALTEFSSGPVTEGFDPEGAVRSFLVDRERWYQEGLTYLNQGGQVLIYNGPMASSKSLLALMVSKNLEGDNLSVAYAKPSVDKRNPTVHSRNGACSAECLELEDADELELLTPEVLVIDEAQFANAHWLLQLIYTRSKLGKKTIVAMLDEDFRGEQWECFQRLQENHELLQAKFIKVHALCACCGEKAEKTQRIVNGEPANYLDKLVDIGGDDKYEPRCRKHHRVPGKPVGDSAEV